MRVWLHKYALSKGVLEVDADLVMGKYAKGKIGRGSFFTTDWTLTKEEALAKARDRQQRKLVSLEKVRKRIAALRFK